MLSNQFFYLDDLIFSAWVVNQLKYKNYLLSSSTLET